MDTINGFETVFISLGGILCIYLGYRLLMIGTNRTFKIFSDLKGWKFKGANLAPGVFFAILGSVVICSPVITSAISILQKEAFINSYATKLILDKMSKRNEKILDSKLESHQSLKESVNKISSNEDDPIPTKLREPKKAVVMSNGLRLRKKPGIHYPIVGSLRKDDVITIKETKGLWLRVSTGKYYDGWVHGDYVKSLKNSAPTDGTETALLFSSNP